jgi:prophage antirepressor-like protein
MQRYAENGKLAKGLQNFQFEGKEVRVVIEENNVLLFVAVDVCNILGYKNVSDVLGRLGNDGVVSNYPIPDKKGRNQPTNMLTEQGLESLISGSKKAEASRFWEWIEETFYQNGLKIINQSIDFQAFIFEHDFFIRAWLDENANVWFVGLDVCKALEYANPHDAILRHCKRDDLVKHEVVDSKGRKQDTVLLNEPNLYRLIMKSNKKEAEEFQDWVFGKVLPTIRKTGKYEMPSANNPIDKMSTREAELLETIQKLTVRVNALENMLKENNYITEAHFWQVIKHLSNVADNIFDNEIYPTLDRQEARLKFLEGHESRLKLLEDIIQHIVGLPADDVVEMVDFYLIQEGDSVWHKMGISADVPERRTALSTGNSSELRVVLTIPFYSRRLAKAFEDYMQDYFKENKKRGEWFALNQNDLLFIERLGMVYRAHYEGRWGNLPKHI